MRVSLMKKHEDNLKDGYFNEFCRIFADSVSCPPFIDIITITYMSEKLGLTYYTSRKIMKELEEEGFVKKSTWGGGFETPDEYGEIFDDSFHPALHGWSLTEKGESTEQYQREQKRINEEFAKMV